MIFLLKLTRIWRQTDGFDGVIYRHLLVESQQCDVVVEIRETELVSDGSKYEARLRTYRLVAAIVLAKCHLYHEPHEAGNAMRLSQLGC